MMQSWVMPLQDRCCPRPCPVLRAPGWAASFSSSVTPLTLVAERQSWGWRIGRRFGVASRQRLNSLGLAGGANLCGLRPTAGARVERIAATSVADLGVQLVGVDCGCGCVHGVTGPQTVRRTLANGQRSPPVEVGK